MVVSVLEKMCNCDIMDIAVTVISLLAPLLIHTVYNSHAVCDSSEFTTMSVRKLE